MCAVLCTVSRDHLVIAAVSAHRERRLQYVIAWLHAQKYSLDFFPLVFDGHFGLNILDQFVLGHLARAVEEILDHVEEPRVFGGGHVFQMVGHLVQPADRRRRRGRRRFENVLGHIASQPTEVVHDDEDGGGGVN